jgi:predicted nucleic-acid-binding Zn-ribbon protein
MKILSYNRGGLTLTVPAHNIVLFEVQLETFTDIYFRIYGYTEKYPVRREQVFILKEFLLSKSDYLTISF